MSLGGIIVSAPGKLILHGEHAVVYGKTALASSLNLRTFLRLKVNDTGKFKIWLPDIRIEKELVVQYIATSLGQLPLSAATKPSEPTTEVLKTIKDFAGIDDTATDTKTLAVVSVLYLYTSICMNDGKLPSLEITVSSHLPPGAGLGSSAAFASCLAASFLQQRGLVSTGNWSDADLKLINEWAFQSEKIIHGRPSGIDNSVSTFGGAVTLQNGKLSFLQRIPELRILLINTKVPRSTKVLVEGVRQKYNKYREIISPVLDSIEAISSRCITLFEKMVTDPSPEDYAVLKDLIEMNQYELCVLGVSHASLQSVISLTASHGLACKLTGAGGGGCAFAVIPPGFEEDKLRQILQDVTAKGYSCMETKVGGRGVTLHADADSLALPHELCN